MNQSTLDELRRLREAASHGPMTACAVMQETASQGESYGDVIGLPRVFVDHCQQHLFKPEDAAFIAAAFNHLPALLDAAKRADRAERAERELAELKAKGRT